MYNIALCLRTDMYCDYMFLLVYSHLQVNSRHKFQPPACRLQQERGLVFLLKLNTRLIILYVNYQLDVLIIIYS